MDSGLSDSTTTNETSRPSDGAARSSASPRVTLISLILLVSALVSSSVSGKESARLRYLLRPGAVYDGLITVGLTTQVTMEGLPEEAALIAQTIGKDLKQQITIKTVLETGRVEKDGGLPVEYRIVDGSVQMTMAGQPIELPGLKDAFSSVRSLKGNLAPGGRALEIDSLSLESVPGLPPDTAQRIAQSMPALPDRELKIGDSFEVPTKLSLPGLPMAGRMETSSQCTYTLKSLTDAAATFELKTIVSGSYGDDGGERMKIKLTGGGEGVAIFDLKEGIFTDSTTAMKVSVTIEMPYPTGPDPVPESEAAQPKIVRIRATMEGPTGYRMSRIPSAR